MSIAITMQQTRRGEDGTLWLAGTTHTATDEFGATMVSANLATVAKGQAQQVPADLRPTNPGATTIPARVVPYNPGGSVYYVDPTAAVHGNGALATPYKDLRDILNPGSSIYLPRPVQILFKQSTTFVVPGGLIDIIPGAAPTNGITDAIVFGVYDSTTGERITGRGAGLATIDGSNTYPFVMRADHANARAWVCIDGLKFINTLDGGDGRLKLKSVANFQVLNCDFTSALSIGVFSDAATGTNYYEGNIAPDCPNGGINEQMAADTASVFQFNQVCGIDIGGPHAFAGRVACNSVQGVSARTSNGIAIATAGGACHVFRNSIRQAKGGINLSCASVSVATEDFTGAVIEDNDIELCKNGITVVVAGGAVFQNNRIDRSGTFDGTSPYAGDNFGRGIEVYGFSTALSARKCVFRFNTITRTFSLNPDGSEGVGIGFDNFATDCVAYGNLIVDSYGCGIQSNRALRCAAVGNVVVNSWCAPAGAYTAFVATPGRLEGAITHIVTPGWLAANNTIVCGAGFYSRYGMSEAYQDTDGGSPGSRLINNIILGAPVAGIMYDNGAGKTAEANNLIQGNVATLSANTQAAIAKGSGTQLVATYAELGLSDGTLVPQLESLSDSTGLSVDPTLLSFAGKPLSYRTPIGALHAA